MLQWFKKHSKFLQRESTLLSNDGNYKELYQYRNNLFISHGSIIVRYNGTHRFPILVIYTNASPYRLPLIFPLQRELSREGVEELSTLPITEAIQRIKPVIKFYHELRHQNSTGVLCFLEWENLDTGSKFFGITTILQRVRDWYAAHFTGEFPPDSQEVELFSHFTSINREIKLFYPDQFLIPSLIEGDCYAVLYNVIPKTLYYADTRYFYSGFFLDGVTNGGIIEPVSLDIERHMLHEKLKTTFDLYKYPAIVNQLISEKRILKASWFHVDIEPRPFHLFSDLVSLIGSGDYNKGRIRLQARCYEFLKQLPDNFILGIRFPNRKGIYEFQLFKIYKKQNPPTMVLHQNPDERMPLILDSFEQVEIIEVEKITEETFHQRNSKRADYGILKNACVNVMGVGAIGSEIADCLAKAGIGRVFLFDDQTLKAHNAIRHLAGLDHVGEGKVTAVAEIISHHNPFIRVAPIPLNLYELAVGYHLQDDSISISSIADDNTEGFINEQLVIANRPAFYVRALRGGKVGRIFRVIPGKDACFNCLTLYRQQRKDFIEISEDPAYPTLKNECNNPIRPASAADLKFIASFAARVLIEHIQAGESSFNQWIWTSEVIPDTKLKSPYQIYTQRLPTHPNCPYCNHDKQFKVTISKEVLAFMQGLIKQNPQIETGGVMAGKIDQAGNIIVTHASEPGPKAVRLATKFEKDVEFCQLFLDKLYIESNQETVYVGEWHSHPSANNYPSGTDIKSLSEIAVQKEYLTENPAMIIYSNTGQPSCTVHPAGKRFYFAELLITNE
jgi:integrative and conjugative element protein (TIGR02256 family)